MRMRLLPEVVADCLLDVPQHGQSALLGSTPACPLRLFGARLAALGSLILPG